MIIIHVSYPVKRPECNSNECWCMSNGGNTCGGMECDPDECYDQSECDGSDGYWCRDDSGNNFKKPNLDRWELLHRTILFLI